MMLVDYFEIKFANSSAIKGRVSNIADQNGIKKDPLDVNVVGNNLIAYRFQLPGKYSILLNKFNTIADHVTVIIYMLFSLLIFVGSTSNR